MIDIFILGAVKKCGYSFEYASDKLKNDKEFVLKAIKTNGYSIACVSKNLRNDKKLITIALKNIYFVNYIGFKKNNNTFVDIHFNGIFLKESFQKILEFY